MENNTNENIEKLLKKQLFASRVTMVCAIALTICFVVITLSIVNLIPQITAALGTVNTVAQDTQELLDSAAQLEGELTEAAQSINEILPSFKEASDSIAEVSKSLNEEGLPKLYETLESLEKLQDINIESLNGAIQSLYDVVQPLARLFGK